MRFCQRTAFYSCDVHVFDWSFVLLLLQALLCPGATANGLQNGRLPRLWGLVKPWLEILHVNKLDNLMVKFKFITV